MRECLLDAEVERVEAVGRSAGGVRHERLREIVHRDLWNYASIEADLTGYDACFFCLGVSSSGMTEAMAAGETLCRLNPEMTFVFVSSAGTDSSEGGRIRWARVKGKTENALLRLPFKAAYMFRPGFIEPLHGARSKTAAYRVFYTLGKPPMPVLRWAFPDSVPSTESIGRAMLEVAKHGAPKRILESGDIRAVVSSFAR